MNIRYFFLRYTVQLFLVIVACFSTCALFGIFYALVCFTRRFAITFPIVLMFTSLWLFWKKLKQPLPITVRIFFASYAVCGLVVSCLPDANGSHIASYFWCGAIPFVAVAFWLGTDAIVSRFATTANDRTVSEKREGNKCASYPSTEEKEIFFREGLERLRTEPLQESSGKMIAAMVDFRPYKSLIVYARRWLAHYPDHEYAPKLVGRWIEKYDSNEAMYLAEYYLRTVSKTNHLRTLLRAIGSSKRSPRRIYDLIESRLEKEPNQDAYSGLQKFKGKNNRRSEKILLRWLELNRSNPDLDILVSAVALFTESVEIIESIMLWAETVWNSRAYCFVLSHLLRGETNAHAELRPRIAKLTRTWIADHIDDANCGRVYGDLIQCVKDAEDIKTGKEWFIQHETNESSKWVAIGLLRASTLLGYEPDLYIVEKIKQLLRNQSPNERIPVMEEVLLGANPDKDSIALVRQTCIETKSSRFIGKVLRLAPDEELLATAKEVLAERYDAQLKHDLLLTLLKVSPADADLRKDVRRWLRKHGRKLPSKELKDSLARR
jgi:hypothetical protein